MSYQPKRYRIMGESLAGTQVVLRSFDQLGEAEDAFIDMVNDGERGIALIDGETNQDVTP